MGDMREEFDALKKHLRAERYAKEETRFQYAEKQFDLKNIKYSLKDCSTILIEHNGNKILFYPYTGWFSGKGIKDGRGIKNLFKQLEK